MGKATEPPKCKVCEKAHWGTCHMPTDTREQRIAKASAVIASKSEPKPAKRRAAKREKANGPD